MTVTVARNLPVSGSGIPEPFPFPDPEKGKDFSATVPEGEAWRVWGGSCHVASSSTNTNRTPTMLITNGANVVFVASNGADYNHDASTTIVFYEQHTLLGQMFLTGAGQVWNTENNPASLFYNPVGVRAIWLPPGTTIRYYMYNIQAGDQVSQVGMLVEKRSTSEAIDGLGAMKTFADPKPGEGWSAAVPAGKRWRVWGGSCLFHSSAVVASRFPVLTYKIGTGTFWMKSSKRAPQANNKINICYYEDEGLQSDLYVAKYQPIGCKAIWLPAGATVNGSFENIDPADQVSEVGLLVEEIAA